ncbi:hypothetical protein ACIQ7Q_14230 [Streptomyces sp. NPDC096176]|uniref:hypothetical protein n=1 Tax=Streptomyces sp. NPDC096176 TaxID=3366079 RepID=UPI0038299009
MCRAHGLPGTFGARAWTNARRTPMLYPDAVTLAADATADDILGGVDPTAPGCSVKDSFASLDLSAAGFDVLFEAQWLHRPADLPAPATPEGVEWTRVATPAELAEWAEAWDADEGLAHLFRTELLAAPEAAFLTGRAAGSVVAGSVVSVSGGGAAAGVSNLFTTDHDLGAAWAGCLSAVAREWPGLPVVGYESGDALAAARAAGCVPTGPLRVWLAR